MQDSTIRIRYARYNLLDESVAIRVFYFVIKNNPTYYKVVLYISNIPHHEEFNLETISQKGARISKFIILKISTISFTLYCVPNEEFGKSN